MISKPITSAITTAGFTAVSLGASQRAKRIAIQARGGNAFQISDLAAGTTYFTVQAGTTPEIDVARTVKGGVLFYAKAVVDDTVEVLITE